MKKYRLIMPEFLFPKNFTQVYTPEGKYVGNIKWGLGDQGGEVPFVILSLSNPKKRKAVAVPIIIFSKSDDGKAILNIDENLLTTIPAFYLLVFPGYRPQV